MDRKPLARPHRGHARVHETDARPIGESRLTSERDAPSWSPCSFETQGGDSPLNCRYQAIALTTQSVSERRFLTTTQAVSKPSLPPCGNWHINSVTMEDATKFSPVASSTFEKLQLSTARLQPRDYPFIVHDVASATLFPRSDRPIHR